MYRTRWCTQYAFLHNIHVHARVHVFVWRACMCVCVHECVHARLYPTHTHAVHAKAKKTNLDVSSPRMTDRPHIQDTM